MRCGRENERGATFCANRECGAVLEWEGTGADSASSSSPSAGGPATEPLSQQPSPPPPPTPTQSAAIGTALNPAEVVATPGDGEGQCRLHIRNEGTAEDTYQIEVLGDAAAWAACEPATTHLGPGQDDAVTVRFTPPRRHAAESTPFWLRVTSSHDPAVSAVANGTVKMPAAGAQPGMTAGAAAHAPRPGSRWAIIRNKAVLTGVAIVTALAIAGVVTWVLIRGDADVDVPEVRGMTPAAVERFLATHDLAIGDVALEQSDEPEGTVIAQSPAAGVPVAPGTAVDITVAEPAAPAVPDVAGRSLDDALDELASAGYRAGDVVEQESEEPEGTVIGQDPASGLEVEPGSEVSIIVAVPSVPDDERCTDAIMSNERWVCLRSAAIRGDELVIEYDAEWADSEPDRFDGFHLHLYGGDGVEPPAEIMGTHAPQPRGPWVIDDRASALTYPVGDGRDELLDLIDDQPKVCARIANVAHELVPDNSSSATFNTGNCVPIDRQ